MTGELRKIFIIRKGLELVEYVKKDDGSTVVVGNRESMEWRGGGRGRLKVDFEGGGGGISEAKRENKGGRQGGFIHLSHNPLSGQRHINGSFLELTIFLYNLVFRTVPYLVNTYTAQLMF